MILSNNLTRKIASVIAKITLLLCCLLVVALLFAAFIFFKNSYHSISVNSAADAKIASQGNLSANSFTTSNANVLGTSTQQIDTSLLTFNVQSLFNENVKTADKDIDAGKGRIFASNLLYSLNSLSGDLRISGTDNQINVTTNSDGLKFSLAQPIDVSTRSSVSASAPLTYNSSTGVFGITQSSTNSNGYLSSTNFNIFNNKVSSVTAGTGLINSGTAQDPILNVNFSQVGASFFQGGNTFGTSAILGTNDNYGLNFITNGITRASFDTSGNFTLNGQLILPNGVNGGLNNNNGGITNAGPITGATGFTSSGTITLGDLSTGVVHADFSGVLSSSALNLASGSSEITGALSAGNGGTGITTYNAGDMIYASGASTLTTIGIGAPDQVLTVAGGVPTWVSISGGSGGICSDCLINDPGSNQFITPSAGSVTGLTIRKAPSGSADIFRVQDNSGSTNYLRVDSLGNLLLGASATSGVFTVAPSGTDPITISPAALSGSAFTGTITSNTLTGTQTWTLPDATGTVCLTSGNCSGSGSNLGGSGTANYITKWSGTYALGNSGVYDNGTNIGIGTTNPTYKLHVVGTGNITGNTIVGGTFNATGATTLNSTLSVTGNTDLNGTLGVLGATTLSSTLGVTGATTIGGAITVNGVGNSYIAGKLGIGIAPSSKLDILDNSSSAAVNIVQQGSGPSISLGQGGSSYSPSVRLQTQGNLGPFNIQAAGANFTSASQTFFDDVLYWGFNTQNGNSKINSNVANLGFSLETDFWNSPVHAMEWNLDYSNPAGTISSRPLAFGIDRDNGPSSSGYQYWQFGIGDANSSQFSVLNKTLSTTLFSVSPAGKATIGQDIVLTRSDASPAIQLTNTNNLRLILNDAAQHFQFTAADKINFGSASDTDLYRSTTGTLKTDGIFLVGSKVGINTSSTSEGMLEILGNSTSVNIVARSSSTANSNPFFKGYADDGTNTVLIGNDAAVILKAKTGGSAPQVKFQNLPSNPTGLWRFTGDVEFRLDRNTSASYDFSSFHENFRVSRGTLTPGDTSPSAGSSIFINQPANIWASLSVSGGYTPEIPVLLLSGGSSGGTLTGNLIEARNSDSGSSVFTLNNTGTTLTLGATNPNITTSSTNRLTLTANSSTINIGVTSAGLENTVAGAASKSAVLLDGAILTGGTQTNNFPHLFIQPNGTTAVTTWSASGTGLGMNLASGFAGNFLDFRVNGGAANTGFSVDSTGNVIIPNNVAYKSYINASSTQVSLLKYNTGNRTLVGANSEISLGGDAIFSSIANQTLGSFQVGNNTVTNGTVGAFTSTSLTTGKLLDINTSTANTFTTGTLLNVNTTSTAGTGSASSYLVNISRSGANANPSHTAYGISSSVTNSGTTSTNIAGYFTASGASNNYAGIFDQGNVGIGTTSPTSAGLQNSIAGAASKSAELLDGTLFTGGNGTTNFPALFIQPSGSTAVTTWNTSGTGLGINIGSGNFLDFHNGGGASLFTVSSAGSISVSNTSFISSGRAISNATGYSGTGTIATTGNISTTDSDFFAQTTGVAEARVRLQRGGSEEMRIIAARGGASGQNNIYLFDGIGTTDPGRRAFQFRTSGDTGSTYTNTFYVGGAARAPGGTDYGIKVNGGVIGVLDSAQTAFNSIYTQPTINATGLSGVVTTYTALYLDTPTITAGSIGTKYGVFQNDTASLNYFGGKTGVGVSPTYKLDVINAVTAQTASNRVLNLTSTGSTYNTTSGVLTNYGGYFSGLSSRSAGSNALTNIGVYAEADSGQNNYGLQAKWGTTGGGTGGIENRAIDIPSTAAGGSNTSGTINNMGISVGNIPSSASGGIVNNYGINLSLSNGGGASGTTNNYGLYITLNGGVSGGGTVNNYSLYNNSTAASYFAGNIGLNNTSPTSAGLQISVAGAASKSAELLDGTILATGGTATTTFPHLFIQPNGTTAVTTWATAGTGLGMNLASGFTGNFLDFHVSGGASVFKVTSAGVVTASGKITATGGFNGTCQTGALTSNPLVCNQDVAEVYNTSESVEVGDILKVNSTGADQTVSRSAITGESALVGIVSEHPGLVFNQGETQLAGKTDNFLKTNKAPIALNGKAPVKVTTKNGAIHKGDLITSSNIAGVGQKATEAGYVVGKALEDYTEIDTTKIGKILVFVNLTYYVPNKYFFTQNTANTNNTNTLSTNSSNLSLTGSLTASSINISGSGTFISLTTNKLTADTITTNNINIPVKNNGIRGKFTIVAGQDKMTISNTSVKLDSTVLLTAKSPTAESTYVISDQKDGTFTILLNKPSLKDINFDYLIIN